MSTDMKVSVALLTYNHAQYITQALDSVLMQQVSFPIEIIVADDCSTDGTRAVIEVYRKANPSLFKLLPSVKNVGMQQNFRRLFFACKGQYIAMLEGDDYWTDRRKLHSQIAFMDQHLTCALSGHKVQILDEGTQGGVRTGWERGAIPLLSPFRDLARCNFLVNCSVVWRNGLVDQFPDWIDGLDMADWPCHLLHAKFGQIGFIPEVMAMYRIHPTGIWSSASPDKMHRRLLAASETMRDKFGKAFEADFDYGSRASLLQLAHYYRTKGDMKEARKWLREYMSNCYRNGKLLSLIRAAGWAVWRRGRTHQKLA